MNKKSVAKFGGSSVVKYPKKIKEIFEKKDFQRNFFVVSAPGKKNKKDMKLTDFLLEFTKKNNFNKKDLKKIFDKFEQVGIYFSKEIIEGEFEKAFFQKKNLTESQYKALITSLGEKLSAIFYAKYLGADFLDSSDIFVLKEGADGDYTNASLDFSATKKKVDKILKDENFLNKKYVVPGFYGKTKNGKIATFSRGGSDLTGSYIAYFFNQNKYENFTDSAILSADPRIVKNPKKIKNLTYKELRDLTYSGFSILHEDVVKSLFQKKIEIEIKSTKNFPERGTLITNSRKNDGKILAVSGKDDFFILNLESNNLNNIDYITADFLKILKDKKIPIEHISTGVDEISVVMSAKYKKKCQDSFRIFEKIAGGVEIYFKDVAIICVSGEGMYKNIGILSKISGVLHKDKVNIISVSQSASERNIIFFIEKRDLKKTILSIQSQLIK